MEVNISQHWHQLPDSEVFALLKTDRNRDLDDAEVAHRQERFGSNVLTQKMGRSPFLSFFLKFHRPRGYILLGAAAISPHLSGNGWMPARSSVWY